MITRFNDTAGPAKSSQAGLRWDFGPGLPDVMFNRVLFLSATNPVSPPSAPTATSIPVPSLFGTCLIGVSVVHLRRRKRQRSML
ncbi:hypothetical protein [Allorhodopirellula heiligendammensis]|uniref:hypothetical protein n=1 Tax=Allorhodopirellula heiligendammensis TaxID=2714739 RepID=UPI0011B3F0EE|nr:hypothetical protein [Allorhodopirellula heiligendammensis]